MSSGRGISRIGQNEERYLRAVLREGFRSSAGAIMTRRLEQRFAETFGSPFAISFVNGTATMHAALAAAGIGPRDEVIVPPLTMASTSFAVMHAGATPVWADVDPTQWTLDPLAVERAVSPRTKAIIPVSLYGNAPDMDALMRIAKRNSLFVLEDAAQCFLGTFRGRLIGTIGDAGSFSFQSSKHMTSGEGGMVTTNSEGLANRVRQFGSLGYRLLSARTGKISREDIQNPGYFRHAIVGYNYRMPELCAAVALGQLERLPLLVRWRKQVAREFLDAIGDSNVLVPQRVPPHVQHSYWTLAAAISGKARLSWGRFRRVFLRNGGDPFYAAWKLSYQEPALRDRGKSGAGLCPQAEHLQPRIVQLKTNYYRWSEVESQARALRRTLRELS